MSLPDISMPAPDQPMFSLEQCEELLRSGDLQEIVTRVGALRDQVDVLLRRVSLTADACGLLCPSGDDLPHYAMVLAQLERSREVLMSLDPDEVTHAAAQSGLAAGIRDKLRFVVASSAAAPTPLPDYRERAIEEKSRAVWSVYRDMHLNAVQKESRTLMEELWIVFGRKNVSAMQILDFLNKSVYAIHIDLVKAGHSYQALCGIFRCEPEVCDRLFQLALTEKEALIPQIVEIAQSMLDSPERSTEQLVQRGLEIYSGFYPASHIVRQYRLEQGLEDSKLS